MDFDAVKMIKDGRARKLTGFCFAGLVFSLICLPLVLAQERVGADESGQEASPSQAQATLASLFGGTKMPGVPRIKGTLALPSFDSSGMTIDEATLIAAQRGERVPETGDRSSENTRGQR